MLPDIESLRCFVEAAELLNFRAAARSVGLSPAALGQRIRMLEDQLDVALFVRTTRRVTLTEAGLALLPKAREAIEVAGDCIRAARGELGPPPMEITLGTRHELGLSWLVPALPALEARLPGVTFHVYFGSGQDLEDQVRNKTVGAAVSSRQFTDPRLDAIRLHREDYVFVAAPSLLADKPFDLPEHAAHHVLIDSNPELPLYRYWSAAYVGDEMADFAGLRFMGTIDAIRMVVERGSGVAVLPAYLIPGELERGELVELFPKTTPNHDHFRLMFRGDDPRRSVYETIAEILRERPLE